MKAIFVKGPEKNLVWADMEDPSVDDDTVLIDIHATALNRADLLQRAGKYAPPPGAPETLGLEFAGRISSVGPSVTEWKTGDRVCALVSGGGYAERIAVDRRLLMPIPAAWNFETAAAMPEAFYTAFVNLFMEGRLREGETVLIHGGASGVGTSAIQLARESGCRVLVTAGSEEKTGRCSELGADFAINYNAVDFVESVSEYTGGVGVDVILDIVGASNLRRNMECLNVGGRLVVIATLGGAVSEIDLSFLMRKRGSIIGSVLRSRSLEEKIAIRKSFMDRFRDSMENGSIGPVIDSIYPITDAESAHAKMAANRNIGKIVLRVR